MPSIKGRLKKRFAQGGLTGAGDAPIEPDYSNTESPGVAAAIPGAEQASQAASDTMAAGRAEQQAAYDQFKAGDNSGLINQGFGLAAGTIGNEGLPEAAPRFYSKLRQVVEQKMGGSAAPEHIMGMIREVKPEEVAHHGVEQFLTGKPKVTKEEMLAHLDSVTPQINEVTKYENDPAIKQEGWDLLRNGEIHGVHGTEEEANNALDAMEASHPQHGWAIRQRNFNAGVAAPKYSQYTLPGGENYRENLYTLPNKAPEIAKPKELEAMDARLGELNDIITNNTPGTPVRDKALQERADLQYQASKINQTYQKSVEAAQKPAYQSSHYDEPNIIAHTRVNDRMTPEGEKVLHAEEIQSDWHQAGREKGYQGGEAKPELAGYKIQYSHPEGDTGTFVPTYATKEEAEAVAKKYNNDPLEERKNFRLKEVYNKPANSGVPDAPLKKTWHEFAANNLLREAAEKNYDRVSWTTGEQQAERYDLSKKISRVQLLDVPGQDVKYLYAFDKDGHRVMQQRLNSAEDAEQYVGKDAAQKLLGSSSKRNGDLGVDMKEISGQDLKVGGEGMKGFYDKIIPNYMNKIGKKYGVKVEPVTFKEKAGVTDNHPQGDLPSHFKAAKGMQPVWSIKLTPEMKADLLKKGFPMFAAGGVVGSSNYAEGGEVDIDRELAKAAAPMPEMAASTAPSILTQQSVQSKVNSVPSAQINMVNPDGNLVSIPASSMADALEEGYSHPEEGQVEKASMEAKYGTAGEMAKAGAEAIGRGFGSSTLAQGVESTFGVDPRASKARAEVNPGIAGLGEAAGFVGSMFAGVGEASMLAKAGKGLEAGLALGKAGKISQFGAELSKAAFEGALYQGDKEAHRLYTEDPNQVAESAWSHIGAVGVISGVFGGPIGYALRPGAEKAASELAGNFVSGVDMPAVEAGDVRASIAASDAIPAAKKESILNAFDLGKKKANSAAIEKAAADVGAPVLPGMTSDDKLVQYGVDTLLNSPATYSGRRVIENYSKGYSAADGALQGAIASGATESKAELGNQLKDSLTGKIRAQYEPIKQAYEELAATHSMIPIGEDVAASLAKELKDIPEFRVAPSSPAGSLVKQVFRDVKNVKSLTDLKVLKDTLSLPATASSQEKRMVGILRDKLTEIEEGAVERFAKGFPRNDEAGTYVQSLLDQKKAVTPQYKKFIKTVGELSEQLGKGRIHGTEDALSFLNERLTPEMVANRLFSKKDSEFLKFFSKNFPEEYQSVRNYQRAEMRDAAKLHDVFSPNRFFNAFNKLEPEIQQALYTKAEIAKIKSAETYIQAFPKNFNPSGTSHVMAFREAVEHPISWAVANARDLTIEKAINMASQTADGRQAITLAQATVKGEKTANKAIAAIFNKSKEMPAAVVPLVSSRAALDKLITKMAVDPTKLVAMNDNNTSVPAYSSAFAQAAARTVNYLASIKPNTSPAMPLDSKSKVNPMQKAAYERALDIAQQPLVVLNHMNDGRVTPSDVIALRTMYPSLYQNLAQKMTAAVADQVNKGQVVPYKIRMGLSLFLGQPLDSTMTPQAIMSIQMGMQPKQPAPQPSAGGAPPANKTKGLGKLGTQAQTPGQAREAERSSGK